MSSITFEPCTTDVCSRYTVSRATADPGTCIPSKAAVQVCTTNFENCACPLESRTDCRIRASIIDIYIRNMSDQRLHIVKDKTGISTTPSSEELNDTIANDEEEDEFNFGGKKIDPLEAKWISPEFSPPNVIDTNETVLLRGVVVCIQKCCRSQVIFKVDLGYTIGIPSKKLGEISASISRTKEQQNRDCIDKCILSRNRLLLTEGFGPMVLTETATIRPPSQIYSAIGNLQENTSQYVITVRGGGSHGGTGCTSNTQCPGIEQCVMGVCTGGGCTGGSCPAGQTCVSGVCKRSGDGLSEKELIIIITVSIASVVIVFIFLYFLLSLSESGKKAS